MSEQHPRAGGVPLRGSLLVAEAGPVLPGCGRVRVRFAFDIFGALWLGRNPSPMDGTIRIDVDPAIKRDRLRRECYAEMMHRRPVHPTEELMRAALRYWDNGRLRFVATQPPTAPKGEPTHPQGGTDERQENVHQSPGPDAGAHNL